MLTEKDYKIIEKQASNLYSELESEIIKEVSDRINEVGYANTVVYNDVEILEEMGVLYDDVIDLVAQNTMKTNEAIAKIMTNAGVRSIIYDDKIYASVGLEPIKINQSSSIAQIMNTTIANTTNNLTNLVNTTANTTQTSFYNAMNLAYLEVSTGLKSYTQAIEDAIKKISDNGINVVYPSGYKMNLKACARMNILTSTSQMCGKMQMQRAEELGWDLMEITAHPDARPEHQEWQGKIVSLSGKTGYLSLDDIGYGTIDGFKGINCRHDWYPYYEGSAKAYNDEELESIQTSTLTENNKLTTEELEAINKYISSDFYIINEKLRNNEYLTKYEEKLVKNLDSALNKLPDYEGKVTRSLFFYNEDDLNDFLKEYEIDSEITWNGYTSTTCGERYNEDSQAELYIYSQKGKSMLKYNNSEEEVLYERNTKVKVLMIEKIDNTYHIWLEEK